MDVRRHQFVDSCQSSDGDVDEFLTSTSLLNGNLLGPMTWGVKEMVETGAAHVGVG